MEIKDSIFDTSSLATQQYITLSTLNLQIKDALNKSFPYKVWVVAEISEVRRNTNGHCYLELVETKDGQKIAQMKATIWAGKFKEISKKFTTETGESIRKGISILLLATVRFHELYGLSLDISDIDPSYSMGDLARKKRETIKRIKKEGLWELNKSKHLPEVIQNIAVVSSPTAAGYHDFCSCLDNNPYRYKFTYQLFPAIVQGAEAVYSVPQALKKIEKYADYFDVIVIVRGGGSQLDLSCFDSYEIASQITISSLPVITGIGHERDDTVSDMVAHLKLGQPRAVAEFIINKARDFELSIDDILVTLTHNTKESIESSKNTIEMVTDKLSRCACQYLRDRKAKITNMVQKLVISTKNIIKKPEELLLRQVYAIPILCQTLISNRNRSVIDMVKRLVIGTRNITKIPNDLILRYTNTIQIPCQALLEKNNREVIETVQRLVIYARNTIRFIKEFLLRHKHTIGNLYRASTINSNKYINDIAKGLKVASMKLLREIGYRLEVIETRIRDLDPVNVLKRGYSITMINGKAIKTIEGIKRGCVITTRLYQGEIISAVESTKEGGNGNGWSN